MGVAYDDCRCARRALWTGVVPREAGSYGLWGPQAWGAQGNREVRMLYMIFMVVIFLAGIAALVILLSRGVVKGGERIAKEMVDEDDPDAPREEEEETRERQREWEG